MMTQRSCCVPGCLTKLGDDVLLHRFPNPNNPAQIERFRTWVMKVGGNVVGEDNTFIYRNRKVCHRHFEEFYTFPNKKLTALAIPTRHIPGAKIELPSTSAQVTTSIPIVPSALAQENISIPSRTDTGTPTHRRNTASCLAPDSGGMVVESQAAPRGAYHRLSGIVQPYRRQACGAVARDGQLGEHSLKERSAVKMSYEWTNKVVLITGAATGIGAAIVTKIVDENVKHIAVLDIAESEGKKFQNELNSKYGANKVKFYKCDVTDEKLFMGIIDTVKSEQGYIDVIINNAGIMNDRKELYKKEIEINVTALITSTLKALDIMGKDKGGRGGTVINMSSIAGLMQDPPLMPIYFATKSAVLQFSNLIGAELYYNKTGVRVLTVCFGATSTALLTPAKIGHFDETIEKGMMDVVKSFPHQSAESAAKGVVETFKQGASGSTWLMTRDLPAQDVTENVRKAYEIMSTNI